jgi:exonuclease VII small subunit
VAGVDIDQVADELYSADLSEFVALRTEKVKEARAAKDRPLAAAIGKLRKPTTVGWAVNLLAHERPGEVQDLLDLGEALVEAQRHLSGAALKTLTKQRHAAVRGLAGAASELASEREVSLTEDMVREIGQTLNAALADPDVAELVRQGRVLSAIEYSGFGPALLASVPDPEPEPESEPEPDTSEDDRRAARDALDEAKDALAQAQSTLDDAAETADSIRERVDELRTSLRRAEKELDRAEGEVEKATAARDEADERVTEAERAVQELR